MNVGFTYAQCPTVFDGDGNPSNNPYWIHCFASNYTLNVSSPNPIGEYSVNWGDGSPIETGLQLTPPAFLSHTYNQTIDTFIVTITEINTGCIIQGVVVMEEFVNASIQIPVGGTTQICAPGSMQFINSSTNVSPTTVFTWNFGDGTGIQNYDYTNAGQTVTHTYQKNTVDCQTQVTLTAENYCSNGVPTSASFNPILVWDVDNASINASANVLCYPDTVVRFRNATIKNCVNFGNTAQRYEYWNFGDYWGKGYDSVITWLPFDPPVRPGYDIAFPGIGVYTITLLDSNLCGIDDATITIQIIPPPTAGFISNKDTICAGDNVTFTNTSVGANNYQWNFGDGSPNVGGFGPRTHTFNNPGTFQVRLIARNTAGTNSCRDTVFKQIVVLPIPTADFDLSDTLGCDSLEIVFTDLSFDAILYHWDFDNGNSSILPTPQNEQFTAGSYSIKLKVEALNGCKDSTIKNVYVPSSPLVDFFPKNACQGYTSEFFDSSFTVSGEPIIQWSWDFGDGSSSNLQNPTHMYVDSGTYLISLSVKTIYCLSSDTFSVTIEPKPTASFSADINAGCHPLFVNFNNNSTLANQFLWNFGNGNSSTIENPSQIFTNTSNTSDSTYSIELIAINNFGCSDTTDQNIVVHFLPKANYTSNATLTCAPLQVQFNNTSVGGVNFIWDFGNGDSSTTANPSYTFQNQTLFINNQPVQLTAISGNLCSNTFQSIITVYPEPIFNFSAIPDSGCSPLIVTFPSVVGAVLYQWDFGDGNLGFGPSPTHTFMNNAVNDLIYTVTLVATSPFGCKDTVTSNVKVLPKPTAIFSLDTNIGCEPLNVIIQNNSTNGTNYFWDFGNTDTSSTNLGLFNYTYYNNSSTSQLYNLNLTVSTNNGCTDSYSEIIQVYPRVTSNFTYDSSGCSPKNVQFFNSSVGAVGYFWDFGNGQSSISTNPSHQYVNNSFIHDTVFNPILIATNIFNCKDTAQGIITVFPTPFIDFSASPLTGCQPLNVQIQNNSIGVDSFLWNFGNGTYSFQQDPQLNYVYPNTGSGINNYTLTFLGSNQFGCMDSHQVPIQVYPLVEANFSSDTMGCSPYTVSFSNLSTGASSYYWDFGNGLTSIFNNPTIIFTNSSPTNIQSNTVTLIAKNIFNCNDTFTAQITVLPKPEINISSNIMAGCQPLPVNISNNSLGVDTFYWNLGDGTTSNSSNLMLQHTYSNLTNIPLTNSITFIGKNQYSCVDSQKISIEVFPYLEASFTSDTTGCSPISIQFANQSEGATQFLWDFGDGQTSLFPNPVNTFINTSSVNITFPVTLVVQSGYGCYDTSMANILVYPSPEAQFSVNPTSQKFPNATVSLNNLSTTGAWSYTWSFGDGNQSTSYNPISHSYNTWGDYIINLNVFSDYCKDSISIPIQIIAPLPIPQFIGSADSCRPVTVSFINQTLYGSNYLWNFGDGGFSTQVNPVYTYYNTGTYTITLQAIGFSGDTATILKIDSVKVRELPVAYFDRSPTQISIPNQPVQFYNLSNYSDTYFWNFGDSTTSTEENPIHYYTSEGIYDVFLISQNEFGCIDSFMLENAVIAKTEEKLIFPDAFTPNLNGPNGGKYNPNSLDNDIFFPMTKGVLDYHLMIFNRWGELVFESFDIFTGWDGYYKNVICKQDVYVWKVEAVFLDGQKFTGAGNVTLIR